MHSSLLLPRPLSFSDRHGTLPPPPPSRCVAYTVVGRFFALKRWTEHWRAPGSCPDWFRDSADLHAIFAPAPKAPGDGHPAEPPAAADVAAAGGLGPIPFALEAAPNLAAAPPFARQEVGPLVSAATAGASATAQQQWQPQQQPPPPPPPQQQQQQQQQQHGGGERRAPRATAVRETMVAVMVWAQAAAR